MSNVQKFFLLFYYFFLIAGYNHISLNEGYWNSNSYREGEKYKLRIFLLFVMDVLYLAFLMYKKYMAITTYPHNFMCYATQLVLSARSII